MNSIPRRHPPASGAPVGVIGGGLAGLAAACVLGARGHRVILFEKNDWLGGKAAVLEEAGFRFDMGPTILTVPEVLRRIFSEAGVEMNDRLDLRRIDPQWRCFFDDGSVLDLHQDVPKMQAALRDYAPGTEAGYGDFIGMSENLHRISQNFFFWRSVEDIRDTLDLKTNMDLATLRDVMNLKMGSSVARQIRKKVGDKRVAQMLDHFVQYVGSSPYGSPAVLCSIAHMQTPWRRLVSHGRNPRRAGGVAAAGRRARRGDAHVHRRRAHPLGERARDRRGDR